MIDWNEVWRIQSQILTGKFEWNNKKAFASRCSKIWGPEMMHVGSHYENCSKRIAFIGINSNYKTRHWWLDGHFTKKYFDYFLQNDFSLTFSQCNSDIYHQMLPWFDELVASYDFSNINHKYSIKVIMNRVKNRYQLSRNYTENSTSKIIWTNIFPFEGLLDAGTLSSEMDFSPYGHITPLFNLLKPDLVFVFHGEAWTHLTKNYPSRYGLVRINDEIYRRQGTQEFWIHIYHYTQRTTKVSNIIKKISKNLREI